MSVVKSIQVSMPKGEEPFITSFGKENVTGPVRLYREHLAGDGQADTEHHGGVDKAVLMYSERHYDAWRLEYPALGWTGGAFGENLTVSEWQESDVCIGDIVQIGDALLQVSQPRIPCWKIAKRWDTVGLTERVRETGRTGWYLRVLREGHLEAGMAMKVRQRVYPELKISLANDILTGRGHEESVIRSFAMCEELADVWRIIMREHLQEKQTS